MLQDKDEILSEQTISTPTANAIIDALGKFFTTPSMSNKVAAVVALQTYLSEVENNRDNTDTTNWPTEIGS